MASGDTKTNQYLDIAANGTRADLPTDTCCETRSQTLIRGVAERIMDVEDEVERLENNPDVADIVATYADLQAYDTSQLTDKDVIRVLQDETHDGDSTYYRWSTETQTWTYIGESKQYTDFVGTDGTTAGESGLVPAPATTDADKFLKSDGTWDEVSGGIPTDATFWGASYDSANNRVMGDMSYTLGTRTVPLISGIGTASNPTFGGEGAIFGHPGASMIDISENNGGGRVKIWATNSSILVRGRSFDFYAPTKITNLADPTSAQDAATKNYVDTHGAVAFPTETFNEIVGA